MLAPEQGTPRVTTNRSAIAGGQWSGQHHWPFACNENSDDGAEFSAGAGDGDDGSQSNPTMRLRIYCLTHFWYVYQYSVVLYSGV